MKRVAQTINNLHYTDLLTTYPGETAMLVQCENCQKILEVDENKFTRAVMRGYCPSCNAIIEVRNSGQKDARPLSASIPDSIPNQEPEPMHPMPNHPDLTHLNADSTAEANESFKSPAMAALKPGQKNPSQAVSAPKKGGLTIWKKLLFLFFIFILLTGGGTTFLYMTYVPSLMDEQVSLRTFSIAQAFAGTIRQPLLVRNYLLVNQTAENNAKLPYVAYISVLNKRGIVIAGIFGDKSRFTPQFSAQIEKTGFPKEISSKNRMPADAEKSILDFTVGGQKIHDVAVAVGDTGAQAHVGVFTTDVKKQVHKSLFPLLGFLLAMILVGSLCFYLVARSISRPIRELTLAAEKISTGEINHPIQIKSGGEIGELSDSLERMRFSINSAMERLMQQS